MKIIRNAVKITNMRELVYAALPEQGCVEIQKDAPGKEHPWHQHSTDETIVVLDGVLDFYSESGEAQCYPGDLVSLPCGIRHGSKAGNNGAIYMIAFRHVELNNG
jgi:quercetin dioxygenase-like cupin family protein